MISLINFYRQYLLPIGLLAGTIIGAGVFALPFVFRVAGLSVGFFWLGVSAVIYIFLHAMYADVILRTIGEHRFVGYAGIYLGKVASALAIVMTVIEMLVVLTIYLVLSLSFTKLLFSAYSDPILLSLFWILGSLGIFLSTRRLTILEFWVLWSIVGVIGLIFVFSITRFSFSLLGNSLFDIQNILLPFGPVLFALSGRVAIPSLVDYIRGLRANEFRVRQLLWSAVLWGTMLPAAVYAVFVIGVLALSPVVFEDGVSGLLGVVPAWVILCIGVLGLLSLFSSYIVVGLDVKNVLRYDLHFSRLLCCNIVILVPLALYFFGLQSFIQLVGAAGGIFLSLEGFFILLMWQKLPDSSRSLISKNLFSALFVPICFILLLIVLVYEIMRLI